MDNKVPESKNIFKNHIVQSSGLITRDYRFLTPAGIDDTPLLSGAFNVTQLNHDLILHTADVVNLTNMKTQTLLNGALKLAIVVNGIAHVTYGEQQLHLGNVQPASLIALTEPTRFSRHGKRNEHERTVSLTFSQEWLYGNLLDSVSDWQAIYDFSQTHLATHLWIPSRQAQAIACQILNSPGCSTPLQRLYLESQCMLLIIEALSSLTATSQAKHRDGLDLRNHHRIQQVRDMLESGEADLLSMDEIAKCVNMSASTLQRHFRHTFNVTVFEYLRTCRLRRAMLALQRDGIAISQAASLAGYNSSANFTTALRRTFGVTPGQIKERF